LITSIVLIFVLQFFVSIEIVHGLKMIYFKEYSTLNFCNCTGPLFYLTVIIYHFPPHVQVIGRLCCINVLNWLTGSVTQ